MDLQEEYYTVLKLSSTGLDSVVYSEYWWLDTQFVDNALMKVYISL